MKFLHYPSFNLLCRFSILGLLLVVSACAPLEKFSSDEVALLPPSSLTCWVAAHAPGARTVVSDPEFGQGVSVQVEDAYSSASGLRCKRARITVNGPPGVRGRSQVVNLTGLAGNGVCCAESRPH